MNDDDQLIRTPDDAASTNLYLYQVPWLKIPRKKVLPNINIKNKSNELFRILQNLIYEKSKSAFEKFLKRNYKSSISCVKVFFEIVSKRQSTLDEQCDWKRICI